MREDLTFFTKFGIFLYMEKNKLPASINKSNEDVAIKLYKMGADERLIVAYVGNINLPELKTKLKIQKIKPLHKYQIVGAQIRKLYKEGLAPYQIKAKLKISGTTFYRAVREYKRLAKLAESGESLTSND